MVEYKLEFLRDKKIEKYIEEKSERKNIWLEKKNECLYCVYYFEDNADFRDVTSDIIRIFYKAKELEKTLLFRNDAAFFAFFGAIMAMEKESEKEYFDKKIKNETVVNADGFYNFEMESVRTTWRSLGILSERLFRQCKSLDEKTALITYMLDLEEGGGESIVLAQNVLRNAETNNPYPIIDIFEEKNRNLLFNLLYLRPTEIILRSPTDMDADLMDFIVRLSE